MYEEENRRKRQGPPKSANHRCNECGMLDNIERKCGVTKDGEINRDGNCPYWVKIV